MGIGTAYLITSWWAPEIMRLLGVPYPVRVEYLREHGTRHIVSLIGLQLPALGLLFIAVSRGGGFGPPAKRTWRRKGFQAYPRLFALRPIKLVSGCA